MKRTTTLATMAAVLVALGATPAARVEAATRPRATTPAPVWAIDTLDGRADGRYRHATSGAGVTVYVVDSGVRSSHRQLAGRTRVVDMLGGDGGDCTGHGTAMAALVAQAAPAAEITSVRALGCTGKNVENSISRALEWIAEDHTTATAVVSLSLSGGWSMEATAAVDALVDEGVVVVGAAGNEPRDACERWPSGQEVVLAVAASDRRNQAWASSGFGACVDVWAPGVAVRTAWHTSDRAGMTMTGTSVATAITAGAVARLLEGVTMHDRTDVERVVEAVRERAVARVPAPAGTTDLALHPGEAGIDAPWAVRAFAGAGQLTVQWRDSARWSGGWDVVVTSRYDERRITIPPVTPPVSTPPDTTIPTATPPVSTPPDTTIPSGTPLVEAPPAVTSPNGATTVVDGLVAGRAYRVQVLRRDGSGVTYDDAVVPVKIRTSLAVATPGAERLGRAKASARGATRVARISWRSVAGAAWYRVRWSRDGVVHGEVTVTGRHAVLGRIPGGRWAVTVRAESLQGTGAWSPRTVVRVS